CSDFFCYLTPPVPIKGRNFSQIFLCTPVIFRLPELSRPRNYFCGCTGHNVFTSEAGQNTVSVLKVWENSSFGYSLLNHLISILHIIFSNNADILQ
uniref:Uncharacterized protein n=1 Tax=Cyanistes caeruleus TaxID=156563 RepID=A0A8C0UM41_CYACU